MLIITEYIAKHELKPLTRSLDIKEILNGALKVKNLNKILDDIQNG